MPSAVAVHRRPNGRNPIRCGGRAWGRARPRFGMTALFPADTVGLAAVLYAPCRGTAKVGEGTEVTIAEKTDYPFDETVRPRRT